MKKVHSIGMVVSATSQLIFTSTLVSFSLSLVPIPLSVEAKEVIEPKQISMNNKALGTSATGKQKRWATFPIISSSPETGLMLGGMLFHFFPVDHHNEQASTVDLMAYGTTKEQQRNNMDSRCLQIYFSVIQVFVRQFPVQCGLNRQ